MFCFYAVYNRLPVSCADLDGSIIIRRKMHIQPGFRNQTLLFDRGNVFFPGTVIEILWRFNFFQLHIYWNGVPLICPNQCMIFVKRVSLFLICSNNLFKLFTVQWVCLVDTFNQFINISPPVFIKSNADGLRLMTKNKRNKLAGIII